MSITTREVEQIAALARLELTSGELAEMARDLGSILDHIQELEAVEVEGVQAMGGVSDHPAPMRQDEVGADPLHRKVAEVAPDWQESFFLVPRLAALDADALADAEGGA